MASEKITTLMELLDQLHTFMDEKPSRIHRREIRKLHQDLADDCCNIMLFSVPNNKTLTKMIDRYEERLLLAIIKY